MTAEEFVKANYDFEVWKEEDGEDSAYFPKGIPEPESVTMYEIMEAYYQYRTKV